MEKQLKEKSVKELREITQDFSLKDRSKVKTKEALVRFIIKNVKSKDLKEYFQEDNQNFNQNFNQDFNEDKESMTVRVRDIIEELEQYDPMTPVIYAANDEGEEFLAPLYKPSLVYTESETLYGDRFIEIVEESDYPAIILN